MLILNRRQGEAILLDGGIRIIVLSSDRRGARIGIEAPSNINIQREELVARLEGENRLDIPPESE
jgi:carbon storage regulator